MASRSADARYGTMSCLLLAQIVRWFTNHFFAFADDGLTKGKLKYAKTLVGFMRCTDKRAKLSKD